MLEKEYALKLKERVEKELHEDKSNALFIYSYQCKDHEKCDYKILQEECEKLNFHLYNFKDSPIYKEMLNKEKCSKLKSFIVYSDYSLTLSKSFKDAYPKRPKQ